MSPKSTSVDDEQENIANENENANEDNEGKQVQDQEQVQGDNPEEQDDDIEMEIHLGEFSLDGCYASPPSSTAVSLPPSPIPEKEDQPMERKLLKTLLLINSLEGDLESEHNYIATNFVSKLHHIREGINEVIEELFLRKTDNDNKSSTNNVTVSLNTSDESYEKRKSSE